MLKLHKGDQKRVAVVLSFWIGVLCAYLLPTGREDVRLLCYRSHAMEVLSSNLLEERKGKNAQSQTYYGDGTTDYCYPLQRQFMLSRYLMKQIKNKNKNTY